MKVRTLEGSLAGRGLAVGVAAARFNAPVAEGLLAGALERLEACGVESVTVVRVAGALELPLAAKALARSHDAVVALGAVILGETDHYEHVATQAMAGLRRVALDASTPVGVGVLTVRKVAHARERSLPGPGNKGAEAAAAAVSMARALEELASG